MRPQMKGFDRTNEVRLKSKGYQILLSVKLKIQDFVETVVKSLRKAGKFWQKMEVQNQ